MRNILTVLTLCILTLTTSNVFAEGYDASRRTERLGLSFYDGRPLYIVGFAREAAVEGDTNYIPTHCDVYRVFSNDELLDYGREQSGTYIKYVYENGVYIEKIFYFYVVDDAGEPRLLSDVPRYCEENMYAFMRYHLDNLTFTVSSGDIGVYTFDAISERLKPWLLPALGVALALFGVRYCYRLLVRIVQGESGVGLGGANENVAISRDDYGTSSDYVRPSFEVRDNLEQVDVSNADEYATGAAFGREFTSKAVASNVDLQNEWSRLSASERAELLGDAFESDFGGSPFGERAYPRRNNDFYNLIDEENEE